MKPAMPSLDLNKRLWTRYNWSRAGEEWSVNWGDSCNLWNTVLMPRIGSFLGVGRVVEIGPGYGRLTAFLKEHCESLVLVDVAENCIEFCRRRFVADRHLEYVVSDGRSLSMLRDASIDFVFSFESLVHADMEVLTAYLAETARVLKPGGRAVLHHSNLAALPSPVAVGANHFRARDVSAERVRVALTHVANLECRTQELISWDASGRLLDCISSLVRTDQPTGSAPEVVINSAFFHQAQELKRIWEAYRG
jgi:SAM-dependent methyltransferase